MNFKRPSFKRGGPTGIAQLTPSRQGYAGGGNIGGGGIGGRNLGTRTGFNVILNEFGMPYQKPPTPYKPNFNLKGGSYVPKGNLPMVIPQELKGISRLLAKYPKIAALGTYGTAAGIGTGIGQLADWATRSTDTPAAYAERKKIMLEDPFTYDETNLDVGEAFERIKEKQKIGEAPGFFPRGGKDKFYEDRNLDPETGLAIDRGFLPNAGPKKGNIDFDEIVNTMVSDKKTKTKTDDKPEPTFEDTYQTEFDKIQKLIGDDNTKGMAAIALSEAIGTPGTIADKAAVLNKSLVALMGNMKKDKKEIAMLAYKATKEIEKAKIVAGKQTDSAKNFEELKTLNRIIQDDTGTYNEDQKKNARSRLKVIEASISSLNPAKAQKTMDPGKARETLKKFEKVAKKLSDMDKTSPEYAAALNSYMAQIELLNNYSELMPSIRRLDSVYVGALGKKDGGRIGFANGSPIEQITETETVETSGTPTVQVTQLSFEELRDRLPPEVTDDVIRFLSQSEQALQDFAYIRTAGDIKKFNMKYGLNLVLPAQA